MPDEYLKYLQLQAEDEKRKVQLEKRSVRRFYRTLLEMQQILDKEDQEESEDMS